MSTQEFSWSDQQDWENAEQSEDIQIEGGSFSLENSISQKAVAQYDATQETYSDNESISTITDQIGSADMTGGSGEYTTSGIQGNDSYDLNGFSGAFTSGDLVIEDSYTILVVLDLVDSGPQGRIMDRTQGDFVFYWNNGNEWRHIPPGGTTGDINGSTDESKQLIGATKDGSTVTIREDGQQTGSSSSAGTGSTSEPNIQGGDPWNGLIGEIVVYKPVLTASEVAAEEQRLADKWGLSLS